jgi:AIG2-like family
VIRPLANVVRSERHCVYGIVTRAAHEELHRLYKHAEEVLGAIYAPEAVLTETRDGKLLPALCYIARAMNAGVPADEYIDRVVTPAKEFGFPGWYVDRLGSFRSSEGGQGIRRTISVVPD